MSLKIQIQISQEYLRYSQEYLKYLRITGVILLFNKLTVSIIPHYSTTIPVRKDGNEFWPRAQKNLLEAQAECSTSAFSLDPPAFPGTASGLSGQSTLCCNGKVSSRVKLGLVRRVREDWGWGEAGRERCCDADQLLSGPWETSDDPTFLSSRPSACPDARCHVPARITDLNRMKQWGQILATEIYLQSINSLLVPAEFLKKNS